MEGAKREIKSILQGELLDDKLSIGIYSTDASIYKIDPKFVLLPKDEEDVINILKIAYKYKISILPRGAGTSLAGQTVGNSIVLDFSKYMNRIIEFNEKEKWVRVEPGLVHGELNSFLKEYNLHFSPDEATINRANIGGIIGNNSSGSRSLVFGKAIDHILEAKIALANGEVIKLGKISKVKAIKKSKQNDSEGRIYKTLIDIVSKDKQEIIDRFPKVMRRVSGYCFDEFVGDDWNMAKIICGSEGTLATILEVKLNLTTLPKNRAISVLHFANRLEAISTVEDILKHKPSAIELLDDNLIQIAKSNASTKDISGFIQDNPGAILIVEFFGEGEQELRLKHQKLVTHLKEINRAYSFPFYLEQEPEFSNVWEVRKKGLGLLLSIKTEEKPIPFIEDMCIPIPKLPEYVDGVLDICNRLDTKVILYAHASVGVLHIRPILNLRNQDGIDKMKEISNFCLSKVIEYKGSWSGEHGDGLSRSYGIPLFFGKKIYQDFIDLKVAFDPEALMNPGKIVNFSSLTENLRYGTDYSEKEYKTVYHFRKEQGFSTQINMCNGVGLCHRISGGVMCPSYKATMDEKNSTRGRANALRLTISGEFGNGDLDNKELLEALDLCLSCKSCETECPSNVDMAKLKSEVLQYKYDKNGFGLREFFILVSDDFSAYFSGMFSGIVNGVAKLKIFRFILEKTAKIDRRRILPTYAKHSLVKWHKKNYHSANTEEIVIFADTYINYHEPQIGIAAIKFLDGLGYKVNVLNTGGSKRPLISNGFLRKAKKYSDKIITKMSNFIEKDMPIVVIEPGAYSALTKDIPDLIDDEYQGEMLKNSVISIERFIANHLEKQESPIAFKSKLKHHLIHAHCHQKALEGTSALKKIFDNVKGTYDILNAGCCGMAGAFGFEKEHYDLSKKVFDMEIKPQISQLPKDSIILATGFSCRHQLEDFSDYEIKHWIEVLDVCNTDKNNFSFFT